MSLDVESLRGTKFQVNSESGGNELFEFALAEAQGRRHQMEDALVIKPLAHCNLELNVNFGETTCVTALRGVVGGYRIVTSQEDAHVIKLGLHPGTSGQPTALFGVFDGHAGKEVAHFSARHLPVELVKTAGYLTGDMTSALHEAFIKVDQMLTDPKNQVELFKLAETPHALETPPAASRVGHRLAGMMAHNVTSEVVATVAGASDIGVTAVRTDSQTCALASNFGRFDASGGYLGPRAGCTATLSLVQGNELWVANAGDSRCYLASNGKARPLTKDHKPLQDRELKRIEQAGQFVMVREGSDTARVGGSLAMSRALGDVKFKQNEELTAEKQAVTAAPDIAHVQLQAGDGPLLLACDGVWDVMTGQQAVDVVLRGLRDGYPLESVCRALVEECLDKNSVTPPSYDNITFMVVDFKARE